VQVVRLLAAVLAFDIARDVVHRARPVQRDDGDQVLEPVGLQVAQHVAHARTFHLEHPDRLRPGQHLEGLHVVQRQVGQVDRLVAGPVDQLLRLGQHRQGLQAEEIELHQAGLFDILHVLSLIHISEPTRPY